MKKLLLIPLISCIVLLSGCVESKDLSERTIVQAIAIDYDANTKDFKVIMQFFNQSSEGGQNQIDKTQENVMKSIGTGKSIYEAVSVASRNEGKEMLYSENQLIVLGKNTCQLDLGQTLNFFTTNYQSHPKVIVAAAEDKAEDIMNIKFKEGVVSTQKLTDILKNAEENGYMVNNHVYEIMTDLCSSSRSVFLPMLKVYESETDVTVKPDSSGAKKSGGAESKSEGSGSDEKQIEKTIKVSGGVIFTDGKLVGNVNEDECSGIQFLANKVGKAGVSVDYEENRISLQMFNTQTSIKPEMSEGKLVFKVSCDTNATFTENFAIREGDTKSIQAVTKLAEEKIIEKMKMALQSTLYASGADVFNLESALRHHNYDVWKANKNNMREFLSNAEFVFDVNCNAYSMGLQNC